MSQNQFPGQGGPQNPQQGGGQPYPQQGGGQPYPQQGGQPYPQQGGQPYPQQGGQYPAAGGAGQFGARPGGPGGYPPQPAKPKSTGMVIGVVVAGLAAVGLAGWLLMSLFGGSADPATPTPSVQPTVSSPSTAAPTPSTSAEPTTQPTDQPSPSASATAQPSGSLEVGLGVSVTPAAGWRQSHRDEIQNYTELTNGTALLVTQAFQVQGQVTGKDVVASYMKQITANMTGVTTKEPATMDVKNERLSVGIGNWAGTRATSQGSLKLSYLTIISVRDDGLSVMSTLIVPAPATVASQQTDYLAMTNSLLTSQLKA